MKKLIRTLPVFALVLGIGAAFASQKHDGALVNTKKAFMNGQWVDITGKVLGQDYACDSAPTHNCTAEFTSQGQIIPSTLVNGDYRPL
jgi:hypothetical protein